MTLTAPDYELFHLGSLSFSVGEASEPQDGEILLSAFVEYVVQGADEEKSIRNTNADISILLAEPGDINGDGQTDLLDLSDLTDYFGMDESNNGWEDVQWFDKDGDGSIGIGDIAYLAKALHKTKTQ